MERSSIIKQLIIKELNEVNRGLSQSNRVNPASIKEGKVMFHGTLNEMEEVVALIGELVHKKEERAKIDLRHRKVLLEAELRAIDN